MADRVKAALIRDPSVPAGQPAPLHVVCNCKGKVLITGDVNTCGDCGTQFNGAGWILKAGRR